MKTMVFLLFIFMSHSAQAYIEEKVEFTTADGITLSGYFTKPDKAEKSPALVIQLGSGRGTTDSAARSYNPFAEIARKISGSGFAVLRFDKRGTGYNSNNGSFEDSTFDDYVSDFKAAVRYMQSRNDVSAESLFYMSHSLGGPVIMTAAAEIPPTGIILSASPGRRFSEFNAEQLSYLYEFGEGIKGRALSEKLDGDRKFNELLGDPEEACRKYPERCVKEGEKTHVDSQSLAFWKKVSQIDPVVLAKRLHCPVLVMNGTSDWLISSENDAKKIFSSLNPEGNNRLKILKKLDHFFLSLPSKKASVKFFMDASHGKTVTQEMHPGFIKELKDWLLLFPKK